MNKEVTSKPTTKEATASVDVEIDELVDCALEMGQDIKDGCHFNGADSVAAMIYTLAETLEEKDKALQSLQNELSTYIAYEKAGREKCIALDAELSDLKHDIAGYVQANTDLLGELDEAVGLLHIHYRFLAMEGALDKGNKLLKETAAFLSKYPSKAEHRSG